MKIIQDTREQAPLKFHNNQITEIVKRKLDVGDYGCEFEDGHIVPIVFERKSIADLFGTLGKGYKRFKKEIIRAQEANIQIFIIIEGTLADVQKGYEYSKIKGDQITKQLFTLWLKHNIMPIFVKDRREMSDYIINFYIASGKQYLRRSK